MGIVKVIDKRHNSAARADMLESGLAYGVLAGGLLACSSLPRQDDQVGAQAIHLRSRWVRPVTLITDREPVSFWHGNWA